MINESLAWIHKKNRQKIDGFQIFISEYNYFLSSSKNSS